MEETTLSTYDQIILKGKMEGITEQSLLIAEKLLIAHPRLRNEKIAFISCLTINEVEAIRLRLAKAKRAARKINKSSVRENSKSN